MLEPKYNFKENEEKWINYWQENKIYEFKKDNNKIFSIDTPPPTVNGKIHIGHIFSYSQAEMIARYKRLMGYNVFYPFGFDDNGLPSERLVEKEQGKKAHEIGREEFNKLCYDTTNKYEDDFKTLFRRVGVSADLDNAYKTVSPSTIKISQLSFLELVKKNKCYHKESPALWCNECLTSIAQAELETKTVDTFFNYITFKTTDDIPFTIATTRPELLPAIVAVFVNPNDEKHSSLIGKKALIPLIDVEVPILGDEKVGIDKGTGIVMCCTFGDQTDIEWWKKYNLPLKNIFTNDGLIKSDVPKYGNMKIKIARKQIIEDLTEMGLIEKIEPLTHEVQTHERCGHEIEYTVINQWFIDIMNHKDEFIKLGEEINWHPKHMFVRYKEWVENIMWDWCISRQRYFGVPFPVWYCKDCGNVLLADESDLPVNPLTDEPHTCSCGSNNYIPETDVMDTWQTSSVTPLINMKYKEEDNMEDILKPMSLRCNAHDIIRTWDFYTIVKSFYHFNKRPWDNVMVSGFILANKGEKISKSKSNTKMEPMDLINEYSADVVRYWAANGRLGTDMVFTDETLLRGKKLVNKLYNVSKFIEMFLDGYEDKDIEFEYFDKWILNKYKKMEEIFIDYLDKYEVGLALNTIEKFFWNFCDNYIEIVKHRLYRPEEFGVNETYSAKKTCYIILYKLLQDLSIFLPFITEEIHNKIYSDSSIHLTKYKELELNFEDNIINGDKLVDFVSEVRGYKTTNSVSLKTPVKNIDIKLTEDMDNALSSALPDFKATLFIENINKEISDVNEITNIELNIDK